MASELYLPVHAQPRTPGPWSWSEFRGELPQVAADTEQACKKLFSDTFQCPTRSSASSAISHDVNLTINSKRDEKQVTVQFVENLTEHKMLDLFNRHGIKIDFFRCCFNSIISQDQDKISHDLQKDHVTITLPFLRRNETQSARPMIGWKETSHLGPRDIHEGIFLDFLGIYMIRSLQEISTIICYFPQSEAGNMSPPKRCCDWLRMVVKDDRWEELLKDVGDPTFALLPILWYIIYAWADALENVYAHLNILEGQVLRTTNVRLTQKLHEISISLFHYKSLLEDLHKTVRFLLGLPRPGTQFPQVSKFKRADLRGIYARNTDMSIEATGVDARDLDLSRSMFRDSRVHINYGTGTGAYTRNEEGEQHGRGGSGPERETQQSQEERDGRQFSKECDFLIAEIRRLQADIEYRNKRTNDVMSMVFSNITIRDSTAMKQISYVTMFFIPGTFVAGVLGMNVMSIGPDLTPLAVYFKVAIPLTAVTIWLLLAYEMQSLWWPYHIPRDFTKKLIEKGRNRVNRRRRDHKSDVEAQQQRTNDEDNEMVVLSNAPESGH